MSRKGTERINADLKSDQVQRQKNVSNTIEMYYAAHAAFYGRMFTKHKYTENGSIHTSPVATFCDQARKILMETQRTGSTRYRECRRKEQTI